MFGVPASRAYGGLDDMIKANDLQVLATIDKHRREYKFNDMTIALDDAKDLGLFIEAEMMISDATPAPKIYELKEKMRANLTRHGILPPDAEEIRVGYVEMYLMRRNRAAYELGLYKTPPPGFVQTSTC